MARFPVIRRPRPGRPKRDRRDRGQRGAVVVEFALIVPLLLLLVFGIIEFGFMLQRDTIVGNASRDGARVGSLDGSYSDILATITSELAGEGIATASPSTVITIDCKKPDGTACNVNGIATSYNSLAESGSTVMVKVKYTYTWITPMISSIFGTSTTLEQYTQMRVE